MKKLFAAGLLALCALIAADPAFAQSSTYFSAQVRDELGRPITSGVTCQVYTAGGDTAATIYSNTTGTVKGNPFTADSTGQCAWYAAATTAVDLIVWHKRGRARFDAFSIYDHSIIMNIQGVTKVGRVAFSNSSGNKVQTSLTIPKGAAVRDVLIEVTVAVADAHIAIGIDAGETGGDDDGFCAGGTTKAGDAPTFGKSLESTGWHKCHAVLITAATTGSNIGFYYAAFHSGALISRGRIGTDTYTGTSVLPHAGSYYRFPFVGDGTAKTVVYTTNNKTVAGHFYIIWNELGND